MCNIWYIWYWAKGKPLVQNGPFENLWYDWFSFVTLHDPWQGMGYKPFSKFITLNGHKTNFDLSIKFGAKLWKSLIALEKDARYWKFSEKAIELIRDYKVGCTNYNGQSIDFKNPTTAGKLRQLDGGDGK